MNGNVLIFALVLLGYATFQQSRKARPSAPGKQWWQQLLGVIAFLAAIVIIINPEFVALGFLGDTAFFDLLVLLLSLQLQMVGAQVRSFLVARFSRTVCWFLYPRLSFALVFSAFVGIATAFATLQRFVHRICS